MARGPIPTISRIVVGLIVSLASVLPVLPAAAQVTAARETPDGTGDASGSAPEVPTIDVLDRGEGPRTELRYTAPAGTTQRLRLRTYAQISQTANGETHSGSTPNIRFTLDATVDAIAPDGNLTVSYTYATIEVSEGGPSSTVEETRAALAPLVGVTGVIVMTPKGAVVSNDVPTPAGLAPAAEQVFEQLRSQSATLSVPFPDGTVGDGARWRATTAVELSGLRFRQTATYTLERTRGARTTLSVELRQTAPRQQFTPTGSDESLTLLSSRGTGSGETVVAPSTSVLPVGGDSTVQTRQRLRADGERASQTTTLNLFFNEHR